MEKYSRAGQNTSGNFIHEHCMLIHRSTYTHSEYIILIALSTATQVTQKHLNVTL